MRLVGQLAQLRIAVALRRSEGVDRCLARPRRLLLLRRGGGLGLKLVVGALDRALDQLAVDGAVDDDRPAALELDQHAGGARLVDVGLGEPDLGGPYA